MKNEFIFEITVLYTVLTRKKKLWLQEEDELMQPCCLNSAGVNPLWA